MENGFGVQLQDIQEVFLMEIEKMKMQIISEII